MVDKPMFCYPEKDKISGKYKFTCVSGLMDNEKHCQFYKSFQDCDLCRWKKRDGSGKCTFLKAQEEALKIIKEEENGKMEFYKNY